MDLPLSPEPAVPSKKTATTEASKLATIPGDVLHLVFGELLAKHAAREQKMLQKIDELRDKLSRVRTKLTEANLKLEDFQGMVESFTWDEVSDVSSEEAPPYDTTD